MFILLTLFFAPVAAENEGISQPPVAVTLTKSESDIVVSWTPAASPGPDGYYRVYGIEDGLAIYLGSTEAPIFHPEEEYSLYGVSSVVNEVESAISKSCYIIEALPLPPRVVSHAECGRKVDDPTKLRIILK